MNEVLKTDNQVAIRAFVEKVRKEISAISSGTSTITSKAIHLEKGTCPTLAVLDRFEKNPTSKGLKQLVEISKQDFGHLVNKAFEDWSRPLVSALHEAEPLPVHIKSFKDKVRDSIFDIFKVYRVALDGKQASDLTRAANQFADTIEKEMNLRIARLKTEKDG